MLNKRESTCESKMIAPTKQRMLADRLFDAGQLGKHGHLVFCCSEHVSLEKNQLQVSSKTYTEGPA
jgi:hypothetical protein